MCPHVAQPDYLVAKMALSRASAICELVRREAAQQNLRVCEGWVIRSFLRHDEVAELAEYFFAWTNGSSVAREIRNVCSEEITIGALYGGLGMKSGIVFRL